MTGELLGLVVVWALVFTLPVGVAWAVVWVVITVRKALGKRRPGQRAQFSRDDPRETEHQSSETFSNKLGDCLRFVQRTLNVI